MNTQTRRSFLLAASVSALIPRSAPAQSQVTRIVVPFNAGGATDNYVRLIASELSNLGVQTIVENKPGASGIIGADYVAKSKPDGATLFMGSNSTMANNTVLFEKMPYDPVRDFAPVSNIGYQPSILIARVDLPYKDLKEMIAYAKANPGRINRGSVGAGNISNLAGLLLDKTAGITTTHVPYTGDTPTIQGLLTGSIDIYMGSITQTLAHVQAGKLRILAVADSKRLWQLPDVPTFKEAGYDIDSYAWYCLVAPTGSPQPIVDKLNREINQVLAQDSFLQRARQMGLEVRGGSPDDLRRFVKAEYDRWVPMLKELNIPKM